MISQENTTEEDAYTSARLHKSTMKTVNGLDGLKAQSFEARILEIVEDRRRMRKRLGKRNAVATSDTEEMDKKDAGMTWILARFPDQCRKCARKIDEGEWIMWAPGKAICSDCSVDLKSDKGLVNKFMKERELNKMIRILENRANELADFLNEGRDTKRYFDLQKDIAKLVAMGSDYMYHIPQSSDPDSVMVSKLTIFLKKVKKEYEELRAAMATRLQTIDNRKKRKPRKYVA